MLRVIVAMGLILGVSFAQSEDQGIADGEIIEDGIVENNDILPEDLMSAEDLTILLDEEEAALQDEVSVEESASADALSFRPPRRHRPHRPPVVVRPPHRPPVVVHPPHRPPVVHPPRPPYPPPGPFGPVVCQAQNNRGIVFFARGARPIVVQQRALNRCYGESVHCVALGCYRVY